MKQLLPKWMTLLLLCALSFTFSASADTLALTKIPKDNYEDGLNAYNTGNYRAAADSFRAAGNYQDAKKWVYYCEAIDLIRPEMTLEALQEPADRFELLSSLAFQDAAQWYQYCEGREYEQRGSRKLAEEKYSTILVSDSIERFFACKGKPDLLDSQETVRQRMQPYLTLIASDLYANGIRQYITANNRSEYQKAADFFCLAGNYQDARQWHCYCLGIQFVMNDDIASASVIFKLLSNFDFQQATDWFTYCEARELEASSSTLKAQEYYKRIFIHDSSDRYMKLKRAK